MGTITSLLLLLLFLFMGFFVARLGLLVYSRVMERLFSIALYLLLFSMGLRLGQSKEVLSSLSLVGTLAIASAVCASFGTVLLQIICIPIYRKLDRLQPAFTGQNTFEATGKRSRNGTQSLVLFWESMKKPGILLILVILGSFAGYILPAVSLIADGSLSTSILYALLFIIGMQMAGSGDQLGKMLMQPTVLLIPLVTIVGTLVGSLSLLVFSGMTVGKALALGSGFGWYSLSGVLITDLGDPVLGAAAFLSNLFRETIAFLAIPLLRLTGRYESGIGISGATSMDVTLPVIEDTWGSRVIPVAVAHGAILSFLVPFLVPLCMSI